MILSRRPPLGMWYMTKCRAYGVRCHQSKRAFCSSDSGGQEGRFFACAGGGITFLPVQWSRNSAKVQVSLIALPPPESSAASGCAIPAARRGCTCGQGWRPMPSRCAPFRSVRPVPYSGTSCACPASPF